MSKAIQLDIFSGAVSELEEMEKNISKLEQEVTNLRRGIFQRYGKLENDYKQVMVDITRLEGIMLKAAK